jgi:hypothetical protein
MLTDSAVAIAASYAAKAYGIKTGTLVREARRLCPAVMRIPGEVARESAIHRQSIPLRIPSRERGRIGSNAGPHSAAPPDILDQRRETVEHPFGTIKQWMNQGAFLMRGLEKGNLAQLTTRPSSACYIITRISTDDDALTGP